MYDVINKDSFDKVKTWRVKLRKYLESGKLIIIEGNKRDIVNKITQ